MKRIAQSLIALAALAAASTGSAASFNVTEPWVKPARTGGMTEAYMQLASPEGTTIVSATSPVAASIALMTGKSRQSAPYSLVLPPKRTITLAENGTRFALMNVERPLNLGDRVPITLVLRHADGSSQEIPIDAEVRRHSPSYDHGIGRHSH